MDLPPVPSGSPNPHTVACHTANGSIIGGSVVAVAGGIAIIVMFAASVTPIAALIPLLFVGIGVFAASRGMAENANWHPVELQFAQWPLTLGGATEVIVIRRAKKAIPDVDHVEITATLTCTETVTYTTGSGDNTQTNRDREVVARAGLTVTGSIGAGTFRGTGMLDVPTDSGAPTLELDHHEIEWSLDVDLGQLSSTNAKIDIDCLVIAELDRRFVNFNDAPPPPRPFDV